MTPVNKMMPLFFLLIAGFSLAGCSTKPVLPEGEDVVPPAFSADRILGEKVEPADGLVISDPWEGFNRSMYRFNYRFDKYVFLPVVGGYQFITPDPVEKGIHNFFRNIQDITTLFNSIFQLNLEKTMNTTTRLAINSTVGLLGFLDIANDVPRSDEDFGQTLGYWGVGNGPFLVLPIMGPSNVRDGIGLGVDWLVYNEIRDRTTDMETWQEYTMDAMKAIDQRANVAFRYYETGSPFEYEWVRLLYTTKRKLDVER
jgi:phospholipid-binding lipoprotein MlaA